jgi:assimilatory nitrate reductase catalytic subunit
MTPMLERTPDVTLTTCPYCAVQCTFEVEHAGNELLGLRSTPACPVAHGSVCKKGLAALEEPRHEERLLTPLVRRDGELVPASWEEALERIASNIRRIQTEHGRDAFAVFGGGSLTNEKAYLLGKFARVALKTANIDYNGRFCMSSAAAAMRAVYGLDRGLPFPLEQVAQASCIVLWGSNLAETLPPISQFVVKARKNGAPIIVIDPRATPSTRLGTLHIPVQPGGDLALALGLLNALIAENLIDPDFLAARVTDWEAVAQSVRYCTPAWAAARCGVDAVVIRETARLIGSSAKQGRLLVLSGRGPEQSSRGVETIKALINLALAAGGLYAPLTGQGNGQGGREHGQKNDQLPGYRLIENPADRAFMSDFWGISESELPRKGLSAQELLEACGDRIKGLFVLGSNPVVSAANTISVTRKLGSLDHLVVVDFFLSETAQLADVVLPGSMWLEEDGTMTNLEGRVLRRRRVTDLPGQARADWEILCDLAQQLGMGEFFNFNEPRTIFEEFRLATRGGPADYSGITYEKIGVDGVFYPCPSLDHPGTPEPFKTGFAHSDGKAHLEPIAYRLPAEIASFERPIWFTTGRNAHHYQSGTQTRRNHQLNPRAPHATLEMHPNLARQHGVQKGEQVRVVTEAGHAEFEVAIFDGIREDTVYTTFHYPGLENANRAVKSTLDPTSRMPDFKATPARLERVFETASEVPYKQQISANAMLQGAVLAMPQGYGALLSGAATKQAERTRAPMPSRAARTAISRGQTPEARVVTAATMGFTLMFAVWVMFSIVGLALRKELGLSDGQFALLTAIPILTGSLLRLPAGIMAERFGGRNMFVALMLFTACTAFLLPTLTTYSSILTLAFFIGLAGVSFAIGNAWIGAWVPKERSGLALGTFGAGNVGASITKLFAPAMIGLIPASSGLYFFGWRFVPFVFGCALVLAALFVRFYAPKDKASSTRKTMLEWLHPLSNIQVWRFGLYYVIFFGAYVALSLWLPKYYEDVYDISLSSAGLLTALFIFPASLLRPLGGYLSDKFGARPITLASFIVMMVALAALALPSSLITLPIFTALTIVVGVGMGVGKASNYKLVTHWYAKDIGVVGGLVGLLGGLGGFALPLIFGALGKNYPPAIFVVLTALTIISFAIFYIAVLRLEIKRLKDELEIIRTSGEQLMKIPGISASSAAD